MKTMLIIIISSCVRNPIDDNYRGMNLGIWNPLEVQFSMQDFDSDMAAVNAKKPNPQRLMGD
jgi:hypothetical protein